MNSRFFCDAFDVADKNSKWKSELQALFAKRLKEEMDARKLSGNGLARIAAKAGHRLGQPTISRILDGKQDPSLERVYAIAESLGLPAWFLLTDASQVEQRVIRAPAVRPNVVQMKSPYKNIFTGHAKSGKHDDKSKTKRQRHT